MKEIKELIIEIGIENNLTKIEDNSILTIKTYLELEKNLRILEKDKYYFEKIILKDNKKLIDGYNSDALEIIINCFKHYRNIFGKLQIDTSLYLFNKKGKFNLVNSIVDYYNIIDEICLLNNFNRDINLRKCRGISFVIMLLPGFDSEKLTKEIKNRLNIFPNIKEIKIINKINEFDKINEFKSIIANINNEKIVFDS